MDQALVALPILAGQADAARAFLRELAGGRQAAYAASERRLGVTKEVWALQPAPQGDLYVVYVAGQDIGRIFREFAASQDEFDHWFKQQVQATTGIDLNAPPAGPRSEILADYQA